MKEIRDGTGMVDVTAKAEVRRTATSTGLVRLRQSTVEAIRKGSIAKGDPLSVARVAALLAVKDTPRIIPMCHNIPITAIDVDFELGEDEVKATVRVTSLGKTGVEMEAVTGACAALLTIWDMVKSLEKDETGNYPTTRIEGVTVVEKRKDAG